MSKDISPREAVQEVSSFQELIKGVSSLDVLISEVD